MKAVDHLDDPELVKAYEQSLALTRQIGRTIRNRRERIQHMIEAVYVQRQTGGMCCDDEPPSRPLA